MEELGSTLCGYGGNIQNTERVYLSAGRHGGFPSLSPASQSCLCSPEQTCVATTVSTCSCSGCLMLFFWVHVLEKGVMDPNTTIMIQHRPHLRRSVGDPSVLTGSSSWQGAGAGCKEGDGHFQALAPRHGRSPAVPLLCAGMACRRLTPSSSC